MASIEDQIRQRWGQYGDWNSAGIDQVSELGRLLQANGITDLGQLKFEKAQWDDTVAEPVSESNDGNPAQYQVKRDGFNVRYGDRDVGYLGDINRDGSLSYYQGTDPKDPRAKIADQGNLLAWSSRGGGHTNFSIVEHPQTGEIIVVPNWGSSSKEDFDSARSIASILALAAGGYYAGASGTTGAVAQGALQGQGLATAGAMAQDGDVGDIGKAGLSGAIAGGLTGGIKAYGAEQGWSPATTKAVSAGTNTALRGGDGQDILKAGLLSGAGSIANVPTTSTSTGSSMDFSIDPSLYDNGDFGTVLTNTYSDPGAFDFSNFNQYDFGFDPSLFATDGGGFDLGKMLKSFLGSDLGKLGLAGLAAYDAKDQKQTMTKDPWGPAQPYLKGLMADGATLYDQYKQNPFSAQQKTAYNNLGGLLNTINANAGGLMSGFQANASGANNFDRSNPRKQLTGSSFDMSQFAPGLFNFFPK